MLRSPAAWGYDKQIIDEALKNGVKKFVIYDKDTDKEYTITTDKFIREHFVQDRGYGTQCFVTIDKWSVAKDNQSLFEEV